MTRRETPEVTKMARPASEARSSGSSERISRQLAVTFTAMIRSKSLGSMWPIGDSAPRTPALPSSTSSRPKRSWSAAPRRSMPGPSVTSSGPSVAEPPSALILSSIASSPPTVRATSTQCAPSPAKAGAAAAPRPREAPVISARRPARRPVLPSGAAVMTAGSGGFGEEGELAIFYADLVVERDRIVAGEAGVAEGGLLGVAAAGQAHGAVEAVDRHEGQRIDADELRHAGDVVVRGQELVALGRIDAVEARMGGRWCCDAHVYFAGAGLLHHLDDLLRGRAAHDRIVDQDHALAFDQRAVGVVLEAHAEVADVVGRLDEGAADIMVADDAEFERQAGALGVADRRRHAGVGDRHDDVGRHRTFHRQFQADALARLVDADALEARVGAGEIDVLEDAEAARLLREGLDRTRAVAVDDDDLAGLDVALEAGADDVEDRKSGVEG